MAAPASEIRSPMVKTAQRSYRRRGRAATSAQALGRFDVLPTQCIRGYPAVAFWSFLLS